MGRGALHLRLRRSLVEEENAHRGPDHRFMTSPIDGHAIILFRLLPDGFRSADLRQHLASLTGRLPDDISQGAITYQLRRLRLHGIIERLPHSFCYRVTQFGFRAALFFTRLYSRLLRPGLAAILPGPPTTASSGPTCRVPGRTLPRRGSGPRVGSWRHGSPPPALRASRCRASRPAPQRSTRTPCSGVGPTFLLTWSA